MPSMYDAINFDPGANMPSPLSDEGKQMMMMQMFQQNQQKKQQEQQQQQQAEPPQGDPSAGILPQGSTDVSPMQAKKSPSMIPGIGTAEALYNKLLDQRQKDGQNDRDTLAGLKDNKPSGLGALDLSPAFNFADAMTGSQMQKGYVAPTQIQDWKDKQALLKKAVDDNSNKVNDDVGTLLKAKIKEQGDSQRNQALIDHYAKADNGLRQSQFNDKLVQNMKKDLDPDASRAGNFGKISSTKISAEKLQALQGQAPDGNLDSRQMEEYALGLANMLSGASGAARSQVEALVPHTLYGKAQTAKEYLLSEPQGAGQQAFVKRMSETVQREKDLADEQLNSIRAARLPAHATLQKSDPQAYNALLQSYQLDPSKIKNGVYQRAQAAPAPQGGEMVTVSNGKETLQVSPADLQHAIADGYKQVQ